MAAPSITYSLVVQRCPAAASKLLVAKQGTMLDMRMLDTGFTLRRIMMHIRCHLKFTHTHIQLWVFAGLLIPATKRPSLFWTKVESLQRTRFSALSVSGLSNFLQSPIYSARTMSSTPFAVPINGLQFSWQQIIWAIAQISNLLYTNPPPSMSIQRLEAPLHDVPAALPAEYGDSLLLLDHKYPALVLSQSLINQLTAFLTSSKKQQRMEEVLSVDTMSITKYINGLKARIAHLEDQAAQARIILQRQESEARERAALQQQGTEIPSEISDDPICNPDQLVRLEREIEHTKATIQSHMDDELGHINKSMRSESKHCYSISSLLTH